MTLSQWTNCVSNTIGALAFICIINPWFLCVLPFFGIIYTAAYYLSCSATRDLQRLEAVTRSPIFTQVSIQRHRSPHLISHPRLLNSPVSVPTWQFSETLNGLSTIRAFGRTSQFEQSSLSLVAANTRCFFNQDAANQWISQRLVRRTTTRHRP